MKTTFSKLFCLIALAVILAGGSLTNTASAQGILGGVLSELFGGGHCDHPSHFYDDEDYGYDNYAPRPVYRPKFQPMPVVRSSLPQWLLGKWQLVDGRAGGATEYEITADARAINRISSRPHASYLPTVCQASSITGARQPLLVIAAHLAACDRWSRPQ